MMIKLLEQQKFEMSKYRKEMSRLLARERLAEETEPEVQREVQPKMLKPTMQKLGPDDDIEHFSATFEQIAV